MRSSARIPSLDGWRAISILLVLVGHEVRSGGAFGFSAHRNALEFLAWHFYGVQVFFIISGFIITHLLTKERGATGTIDFQDFYRRRFFRIIPALATFLACLFLLSIYFHGETMGGLAWFKSFLFLGNFHFGGSPWSTLHLWSLSVEEQFYLFWPLMFFHKRTRSLVPLLFIVLCPVFRMIDYKYPGSVGEFSFFTRADSIFMGSLFAIYRDHPIFKKLLRFSNPILIVTAFSLIAQKLALPYTGIITVPFGYSLFSLGIIILIDKSLSDKSMLFRILNTRLLVWIGGISYSLYLWQELFYPGSILGYIPPTMFPLNFVMAFLFAWLSSRFIEQPILAWRKRARTYQLVS